MSDMLRGSSPDGYRENGSSGLLPQRSAGILGGAVAIALIAGALTGLGTYVVVGGTHGIVAALVVGAISCGTAFAGAARFLHWIIAR